MTQLFEFMSGGTNNFASLVCKDRAKLWGGIFNTNGKPKTWDEKPQIEPFVDKKKKKQAPVADISYLVPGTVVLNERAYIAAKDFLSQFGEFLEVDCLGGTVYFYNITNLLSCIDFENSEKIEGAVIKATFLPNAIPDDILIFKDPLTAGGKMYITEKAKLAFEKIIADANLTGIIFFKAGENWY